MTTGSPASWTPGASNQAPTQATTRRLHRSRNDRVLAGVCAGIAEHYGSDRTAVRLATLVIGLFTGIVPMIVLYIVAAIVVPDAEDAVGDSAPTHVGSGEAVLVLGAFLLVVGIAGFVTAWFPIGWDKVWPLALIGLGVVIVVAAIRPRQVNGTGTDPNKS